MPVDPPHGSEHRFVLRRLSNIAVTLAQGAMTIQIGDCPNLEAVLFE